MFTYVNTDSQNQMITIACDKCILFINIGQEEEGNKSVGTEREALSTITPQPTSFPGFSIFKVT
jgi:hypothetical protein